MNFLSNVLNAIPVVGHVKGVVHYAVGDTEGGHQAMYQSTRTTAVLAGGAAGCIAGPAGAVAGAMSAGLATDTVASIAMDKPQGIIEGVDNIGNDITHGRNPTKSILTTSLQVGLDGVGGLGMGGVSSAAGNISEKAIAKTIEKSVETIGKKEMTKIVAQKVTEKAVKKAVENAVIQAEVTCVTAHIGINAVKRTEKEEKEKKEKEREREREREKERERERERERKNKKEREERERKEREKKANEEKQQGSNQGSSSGSGPPRKNQNNKKNSNNAIFDAFMKLLKRLLKQIYGNEREQISDIFEALNENQIEYLANIIQVTINTGTLNEVVELVIRMFKEHMSSNISFENFLSLIEFARAYLLNEIDSRQTESTRYTRGTPSERRAQILRDIMRESDVVERLVNLFKSLQAEIKRETAPPNGISPDFRDIFAAVYHYYKHRLVPEDGILTVKQYYDWIRKILAQLKKKARYRNEVESQSGPVTCTYEIYVVLFGRRFRVVVKVRRECLVLSSAFVVDIQYVDDKEGDEFLKIFRKK